MNIHLTKKQIRQVCLSHRNALSLEFINQASYQIIEQIKKIQVYNNAFHIAYYFPIHGEVDLSGLWQNAIAKGKYCYFPMIQSDHTLVFLPYTPNTTLRSNRFGILEPDVPITQAKSGADMDLIFLPLVAFDNILTRLGMGGGFYDKTLQHSKAPFHIGVAYEWQKYSIIPRAPWDIPLDMVVTEKNIYTHEVDHSNHR
ncbi:MAG TPA: 5-formyltetrahydrofolate cyclo-ligase [Legionellaceae bacterium]|nr:5-formyltetrahydrofolate cyclo-ligase [Legionellaceae bacterium]